MFSCWFKVIIWSVPGAVGLTDFLQLGDPYFFHLAVKNLTDPLLGIKITKQYVSINSWLAFPTIEDEG